MSNTMNENVRSAEAADRSTAQKYRIHGLLFDPDITDVCPLCEYERTERIASVHD